MHILYMCIYVFQMQIIYSAFFKMYFSFSWFSSPVFFRVIVFRIESSVCSEYQRLGLWYVEELLKPVGCLGPPQQQFSSLVLECPSICWFTFHAIIP